MFPVLARFGPITIGTHDFFTILGLLADLFVRLLERVLLSWRPSFTGT